jgi:hypothetical protein
MRPSEPPARWLKAQLPVALVIACLLLVGCGPRVPAGKVLITGTVLLNGAPLEGGVVNFFAKEGTANGAAGVGAEGIFRVFLVPGEYAVAVRDNGGGLRPPEKPGAPPVLIPSAIPERYRSANTSGLSVTAVAGARPVTIAVDKQ